MTDTDLFVATEAWRAAHPGAVAGVLAMRGVANPESHPALDEVREALQSALRERYAGKTRAEIRATGSFPANDAYYRRFGQNYHVLMQVDSIVNKGKAIPRRAALVEAAFMAELDSGLLTASHDLDAVSLPITIDVVGPDEHYELYNGTDGAAKPGDMVMRDADGTLTTIISGPAANARITPETTAAIFCVYAPPGIEESAVRDHLAAIERNVRLIAPEAEKIGTVLIRATEIARQSS